MSNPFTPLHQTPCLILRPRQIMRVTNYQASTSKVEARNQSEAPEACSAKPKTSTQSLQQNASCQTACALNDDDDVVSWNRSRLSKPQLSQALYGSRSYRRRLHVLSEVSHACTSNSHSASSLTTCIIESTHPSTPRQQKSYASDYVGG